MRPLFFVYHVSYFDLFCLEFIFLLLFLLHQLRWNAQRYFWWRLWTFIDCQFQSLILKNRIFANECRFHRRFLGLIHIHVSNLKVIIYLLMIKNRCSSLCLRQLQVLGYSHLIHLKSSLGLRPLSLSLLWRIPLLLFVASGTYPCCFSIRSNAAFCSALKNGLIRLRLLFHLPRFLPFCCLPALVFMLVKGNIVRRFLHSFLVLMIFRCCLSRLITLIFES